MPPHAPCRLQPAMIATLSPKKTFASTRSVQIATRFRKLRHPSYRNFASTRSVQIATAPEKLAQLAVQLCLHTLRADCNSMRSASSENVGALPPHAPCRLQHRFVDAQKAADKVLCLHTLRADCNADNREIAAMRAALPPHAPCRLQPGAVRALCSRNSFASTRSVQIATAHIPQHCRYLGFASTRSVQIATAEMHRIAICTFQNVC